MVGIKKLPIGLQPFSSTLGLRTVHKVHKPNIKSSQTTSQAILITYPFLQHVGSPNAMEAFIFLHVHQLVCHHWFIKFTTMPLRMVCNWVVVSFLVNFINFFDSYHIYVHTVNGERFAGLNIHVFHGFQEYRKNFPVNISAFL